MMPYRELLIYLADDDKEDRELFMEVLDEIDKSVTIVDFDNGVTLMDALLHSEHRLPDAIYLDLNMPLMNGEECLDDIKNEPHLAHIPIIIYSTYVDEVMAAKFKLKGANWYLIKPNSYRELKKLLRKSLENIHHFSTEPIALNEFIITVS